MKPAALFHFQNEADLTRAAARTWVDEIAAGYPKFHCAAVSGGRIAGTFFKATVEEARQRGVRFDHVHLFWADERCVPPGHPESNYRLARELLLEPLGIRDQQVHRIRGEETPEAAAAHAQEELCRVAPRDRAGRPVLDLVWLGMGPDGHVASLFPGQENPANAGEQFYRAVHHSPKPPPDRVTLTYITLETAQRIRVLISEERKRKALQESMGPGATTPLGRVLALHPGVEIFSDIAVFPITEATAREKSSGFLRGSS